MSANLSSGSEHFTERHPIHSAMIVPLVAFGEVVGTLGVIRIRSFTPYADDDLAILDALGERAALAIADARGRPRPLGLVDYEAIFRHSLDGVMFTSPDGRILAANPAACEMLARSEKEICRIGRFGILINDDPQTIKSVTQRAVSGSARAEIPMIRGDGSTFIADISSTTFMSSDGQLRACVSFRDVSEQVALRREIEAKQREFEHLAEHDVLSGLLNRRGFLVAAQRAIDIADREQIDIQLMFCDLDDLKLLNDAFGYQVGDQVLERLGKSISGSIRTVDIAARIAGDEFAVWLLGSHPPEAEKVIERTAAACADNGQPGPPATFSVGIATRLAGSELSLNDLLQEADRKMYERKAGRKGRREREV
jgi:diguanylate cyclase (GGDEF)-like protein/PAS domain S-box-containing protein